MTPQDFIKEWSAKKDTDGSPAVGVGVHWNKINPPTSRIEQYHGAAGWKQIENYYAPIWGGFKRTKMGEWLNTNRPDYQKFIDEEESVGKVDLYRRSGLLYPEFCAIADIKTGLGIIADGCHRYIDCNYLILVEKLNLDDSISKCRLDVLLVNNLLEVINPIDYPPELKPKS